MKLNLSLLHGGNNFVDLMTKLSKRCCCEDGLFAVILFLAGAVLRMKNSIIVSNLNSRQGIQANMNRIVNSHVHFNNTSNQDLL